jgi:hypothetical protein
VTTSIVSIEEWLVYTVRIWRLWKDIEPSRGYKGHHIVDVDVRPKTVWHNARPTYVIVQDLDDNELYFGNLTRMVDMQPLDQDLADVYERMVRRTMALYFTPTSRRFTRGSRASTTRSEASTRPGCRCIRISS